MLALASASVKGGFLAGNIGFGTAGVTAAGAGNEAKVNGRSTLGCIQNGFATGFGWWGWMSVIDGDPRKIASDLLGRLTAFERVHVDRMYQTRVRMIGRGKRNYPDDESPESVARMAIRYGVLLGITYLAGVPGVGFAVTFGIVRSGETGWWLVATVVFGILTLAVLSFGVMRFLTIRRYFSSRAR